MSTTRGYLTDAQYQSITGKPSLGTSADAIIGRAETIIDGHLGFWQPAFYQHWQGIAQVASATGLTLATAHINSLNNTRDMLKGLVCEFLSGAAEGKFVTIKSQAPDGTITFDSMTPAPAAGDIYHIYQLGKVPRAGERDYTTFVDNGVTIYAKSVPAALREAVAHQVAYMQELGDAFFDGTALNMSGERFGSYGYTKAESAQGAKAIIAPKARQSLSGTGLINRTGVILG